MQLAVNTDSPGSKFRIPLNCLVSKGCSDCDPCPCVGLYPTFDLKVSPSFATASWTVEEARSFSSGLEKCLLQSAAAKAPIMWVRCSGKRFESQMSWKNPIDFAYSDHFLHTLVSLSLAF